MSPGGGAGGGGRGGMQCVGRLEVLRPKPVGLLCIGSLPVPTDHSFRHFNSALVPSSQTVTAPRYRMLPTETDLNMPPDRVLPIHHGAVLHHQSRETRGGVPWDSSAVSSNLARRGEALAVSGIVEYGDDIDVIAPADILKQIFKMPYSKARLSIAVHRIGHTLVLNTGPGIEEGERLVRRNQPKCADHALFLNFAMHSVRMEACDCPPMHSATEGETKSPVLANYPKSHKSSFTSSEIQSTKDVAEQSIDDSELEHEAFCWGSTKNKSKGRAPVKRATQVGGKTRCSMQESEKYRCGESDEFLRVLFWQFHNFRMLLGSDLLLFSNEKYLAVSLHLWDVSRQVTALTWLDAWLDNVMASVPELAICYHKNGVVQGYELLNTDDIFLMKGISEDGTLAFHPHVVQQNGLSVLRFLQTNCKQDPGTYWLYKSAGEDVIQLFDLPIVPQDCQSDGYNKCTGFLPSFISRRRIDALSSLGTLLYRVAHRLSLSMAPNSRSRGIGFFRKCLDILDESDHLVTLAMAHEQYARLILNNDEGLDLILGASPIGSEVIVSAAKDESLDLISGVSNSDSLELPSLVNENQSEDFKNKKELENGSFKEINLAMGLHGSITLIADSATNKFSSGVAPLSQGDETFALSGIPPTSAPLIQTIADPVSSKLAAVHHVSQAIKSLRWMHQLQGTDPEIGGDDENVSSTFSNPAMSFSPCACGDTDCIEVCDIKQWLPTLKLDRKLWKLILLLGESYLAFGEAYWEDGQLLQALKVVEVACSIYGSMPQYLENTKFISSMVCKPVYQTRLDGRHKKKQSMVDDKLLVQEGSGDDESSSTYLFWSKAWTLVGDVYVEFYKRRDREVTESNQNSNVRELRMPSEVVEELMRLKKKLSKDKKSCNTCSLVNCSCQSDRANSGYGASSSSADKRWFTPGRRKGRRSHGKSTTPLQSRQNGHVPCGLDVGKGFECLPVMPDRDCETLAEAPNTILHQPKGSSSSSEFMAFKKANDGSQTGGVSLPLDAVSEATSENAQKLPGGIFKYLLGPITADAEDILSVSLDCYEQARKASDAIHMDSKDLEAVTKKIGWVCNELGRNKLEKKKLDEAERTFLDAINAFKEVSDSTNVVLINCNLGHGRRALAEELVSKMEYMKNEAVLRNAYKHALETAKMNYAGSLRFYQAAVSELAAGGDGGVDVSIDLRNEVYTQLAHTYLRLGMLLEKEDTVAEVYETGTSVNRKTGFNGSNDKIRMKKFRRHEMSANDSLLKALLMYESLGELRQQEAAYAYFQVASNQRDCCMRIIDSDNNRSSNLTRNESSSIHWSKVLAERCCKRANECKILAERYWEKAIEFYKADTHPAMYLTILVDRSSLSFDLSSCLHSDTMLESALTCLLDGCGVSSHSESIRDSNPEIYTRFWSQLQKVLLKMVQSSTGLNKTGSSTLQSSSSSSSSKRLGEADMVKELYRMSLKSTDFAQLHAMHNLWTSSSQQ